MQAAASLGLILALLIVHQIAWLGVRGAAALAVRWAQPFATSRAYVRDHPVNAALAARLPRAHAFLAARFSAHEFTGLPLTLIVCAAVYIAALLGGLVDELFEAQDLPLFPWHAGPKHRFVRIVPTLTSGRRFTVARAS